MSRLHTRMRSDKALPRARGLYDARKSARITRRPRDDRILNGDLSSVADWKRGPRLCIAAAAARARVALTLMPPLSALMLMLMPMLMATPGTSGFAPRRSSDIRARKRPSERPFERSVTVCVYSVAEARERFGGN